MEKKLLLAQDDCAPDSLEWFSREFMELMKMSVAEFKHASEMLSMDDGFTIIYKLRDHQLEISADDMFYKLYKL